MKKHALVRSNIDGAITGFKHDILILTADVVPGYTTEKVIGLVRGNTIRARHVGKDILAGLRHLVGGEIHEFTKLVAESREQALDRMVDEAKRLGADAVVGVRFTTSVLMGGAAELLAVGTAVLLEDE